MRHLLWLFALCTLCLAADDSSAPSLTITTRNGVEHHLSLSGLPVFGEGGRFKGYRGIGRDLTLLVRAEQHAAFAQTRLIEAIESIPECFMLLDSEDRLVLCNSRYREVNAAIAPWPSNMARSSTACCATWWRNGARCRGASAPCRACTAPSRWWCATPRGQTA